MQHCVPPTHGTWEGDLDTRNFYELLLLKLEEWLIMSVVSCFVGNGI